VSDLESNISWTYHSRASTKFKYVTVTVPKVACSTMKRTLHALEGLGTAERLALEHQAGEGMRLSRFSSKEAAAILRDPAWLRFTFVRNPYDRLLSAWKSKILSSHDTAYAAARDTLRDRLGYPNDAAVAFGDFVRFVVSGADPELSRDGHWERQTVVGLHDVIPYDVVGRFENFAVDFRSILAGLGAGPEILELASEVTNPTEDIPMAAAYDSELAAIVYDYYRDDFERFDYDRNSWLSP
jgi:hypothetical protein